MDFRSYHGQICLSDDRKTAQFTHNPADSSVRQAGFVQIWVKLRIMHPRPTLLLDKTKCLANIERMARKAERHGLGFRPHFKTHQSAVIGEWFREFGISAITVSSFSMAEYFAAAGWKDILVAFPFNPADLDRLNRLSEHHAVSILVDSLETLQSLGKIRRRTPCYIDIDTGYGRTGVRSDDPDQVERIIKRSGAVVNLDFAGFYCHAGDSYRAGGEAERDEIHRKALSDLRALREQFRRSDPQVLYGDTPNCSTQEDFEGIDTITPGNFVFYDLFQCSIGSCREEEIAVTVECPVASKYPGERKVLIHGGAVHFSKEALQLDGTTVFGKVAAFGNGAGPVYLSEISQEHGILRNCPAEFFDRVRIGDMLRFLPVHSCLTANLMGGYVTTDGKQIG
ncbi:MAG TPA: hypothetical protein ENO20_03790, partial [Bacteroides sp.]|nr:hypothetical protein [Bacteroides sp.]